MTPETIKAFFTSMIMVLNIVTAGNLPMDEVGAPYEPPTRVVLSCENVQQLPELPAGCEVTTLTSVMRYYGFDVTKEQMVKYMPMMKSPGKNGRWESPWNVFVGSPYYTYYGAYSPVMIKTFNAYIKEKKITTHEIVDLSGSKFTDLYDEIDKGNPVIIWASINMRPIKTNLRSWTIQDGTTFKWTSNEHCVALIGYDKEKDTVIISDPYDKNKYVEYPRETVEARYGEMYKQALVIHKK